MRWKIVSVGKPRLSFARDGIAEYLTRLRCFTTVETEVIKASNPEKEGRQMLEASTNCHRLVLDERGRMLSSRELSKEVERIEIQPLKTCAVIIGGADGLTDEVRQSAHLLWSLSRLTLQHEMALMFVIEQLYRAYTIRAGLPYHRD